jgi:cyclase
MPSLIRLITALLAVEISLSLALAQSAAPRLEAPGVWFLEGDAHAGYSNSVVIEMADYLILVDPSYPGRSRELREEIPRLSKKPVRYVFDTHAHGDHAYGNSIWTKAGAKTMAFSGVVEEMHAYEPQRWKAAAEKREDVRSLQEPGMQAPTIVIRGMKYVLRDRTREVDFLFLGWAHTRGDGFVWMPREHILCTGDAAVNGPRNKMWDANVHNWPIVLDRAGTLGPEIVLPGHGRDGSVDILRGQAQFLRDLYSAVEADIRDGKARDEALKDIHLPQQDANWIREDMSADVLPTYDEIRSGHPAGSLSHIWK